MYIVYEGACGVCCTAQYCSFYQVQGFFPTNLSWIVPVLVLILHIISQRIAVKGNLLVPYSDLFWGSHLVPLDQLSSGEGPKQYLSRR